MGGGSGGDRREGLVMAEDQLSKAVGDPGDNEGGKWMKVWGLHAPASLMGHIQSSQSSGLTMAM